MQRVESVSELIEQLGGVSATGRVLGTTPQNVVNWRTAGKIPAKFFKAHKAKLRAARIRAPDELWDFITVEELGHG